ncbi:MAG: 4Fe-4S binding protein [Anaerolineae bacterium]|jgi:ferredoxin|nr:4Fe-4S binding protein [Anaerolineae bacterium]
MPGLSLEQIEGVVDTLQSRHLAIHRDRCSRQRHRHSTCNRCLEACPTGALTWDDGLEVDPELCVQCGICSAACPTGAIEALSPSHDELWVQTQKAAQERGWAGFVCSKAAVPPAGRQGLIEVSCLGRIDEALLVGAGAYGARSLWLVEGECAGCPLARGRQLLDGVIARSEALLQAFGRSTEIMVGTDLPGELAAAGEQAGRGGVTRRGLFKTLVRETARVGEATRVPQQVEEEEPEIRVYSDGLPTALPEKRLLLVAALEHMGRPAETRFQAGEGGLWAGLKFSSDCTACQMCAYFCPTGALLKAEHEGRVGVVYQVSRCVNCHLCSDICYQHAVLPLGEVDLGRIMDGDVELLCVRQASSEPWRESNLERTAKAIFESLA